jgi:hypothetical protein
LVCRVTRFVNKNDTGVAAPKLESVLANLEGERAINTVEKTSRDWDDFKIREGIDDDLAQQAKDGYAVDTHLFLLKSPPPTPSVWGTVVSWLTALMSLWRRDRYLERQEFLQRVDVRTFEKEREERIVARAAAFGAGAPK